MIKEARASDHVSVMPGLEESISHDTSSPHTRVLMSDGSYAVNEKLEKYIFKSWNREGSQDDEEWLEILIPEVRGRSI